MHLHGIPDFKYRVLGRGSVFTPYCEGGPSHGPRQTMPQPRRLIAPLLGVAAFLMMAGATGSSPRTSGPARADADQVDQGHGDDFSLRATSGRDTDDGGTIGGDAARASRAAR